MAGRVDGKAALVTGGASGLGAESARLLAAEGARVCLADVRDALAEEVAGEIRAAGGEAFALRHDVTSEAEWQAAVDAVVARWGGLHILLNAAGVAGGGQSIAETSLENGGGSSRSTSTALSWASNTPWRQWPRERAAASTTSPRSWG